MGLDIIILAYTKMLGMINSTSQPTCKLVEQGFIPYIATVCTEHDSMYTCSECTDNYNEPCHRQTFYSKHFNLQLQKCNCIFVHYQIHISF